MRHRDFSRLTAEFSSALCKFNATCWPRWPEKKYGCSEAGHGDVSTQLIQIDCLWAYHGLSYSWCVCSGHDAGLWHLDNRYEAKKSAERQEDYIYMWAETYIIGFLFICRKHITISPYDYTHAQPRTHVHTHTYMYTDTHNMNTAHVHHHNITQQNITWRACNKISMFTCA